MRCRPFLFSAPTRRGLIRQPTSLRGVASGPEVGAMLSMRAASEGSASAAAFFFRGAFFEVFATFTSVAPSPRGGEGRGEGKRKVTRAG